jgi:hypothetical protein
MGDEVGIMQFWSSKGVNKKMSITKKKEKIHMYKKIEKI